ncbi:hypothetical protein AOQ84DRAFT_357641, partial [Glonium stellatum]
TGGWRNFTRGAAAWWRAGTNGLLIVIRGATRACGIWRRCSRLDKCFKRFGRFNTFRCNRQVYDIEEWFGA